MVEKKEILRLLGEFPKKSKLNLKIIKSIDKGKYFLKTISYNVELDERINAYLLVPKKNIKKMPGILALHQHALEYDLGKSEPAGIKGEEMYAYGLELCLRGYVVLCPDHLCFEDRQSKELEGMWFERFKFMEYLLNGSTLQAKYISDILCAVEVLRSLENVDKKNIGVIGHSLGGQEAMWSLLVSEKIKAGVSSGGFSQMKYIIEDKINHSFSTYIPNLLKTCDVDEIVPLISPKKFLIIAGIKDPIFPIRGVKEIERNARNAYSEKRATKNLNVIYHDGGHEFPADVREKAYAWLDDCLKNKT